MKTRRLTPPLSPIALLCLTAALVLCLGGITLTLWRTQRVPLPYADEQLAAAKRLAAAEEAVLAYVQAQGIPIEKDDLNLTGLIGPEWTDLTTSLGMLEAKRTALQPDFAALMVKYYHQAGLKRGDRIACGMSGSFPALCMAAVAAANEMGLEIRIIASYGSSMYGATRLELPIVRMLDVARQAGLLEYEMVAASPGGDFDHGEGILFPDSRNEIFKLAQQDGVYMIDEPGIPESVQKRLELLGTDYACFVNVGGASANVGTSPYTLTFPNGLVLNPPRIPQDKDRGLVFEYAARGLPVIYLLNVRGLAQDNGLPFDPVPLTKAGETDVYYTTQRSPWYVIAALALSLLLIWIGWKHNTKGGSRK